MKQIFLLCLALGLLGGVNAQSSAVRKYALVITNANVVDVASGRVLRGRLLAISGDTVRAVDAASSVAKYPADRVVDVAGKYVMPGLWDMHIHIRGGDSTIEANKALLPLFLSYGVTTVRECGGDITPSLEAWRADVGSGRLVGPRIFTAGPKLDGPHGVWAGSIPVVTPAEVTAALDSLQKIKVDFVKIYDSKISGEAYLEIIRQAKARGMRVTGHMPFTVELKEAAALGMDGSEHLYYVFKACSSREDSITAVIRSRENTDHPIGLFAALPSLYATFSEARADSLFAYLGARHFSITPTLYISHTLSTIRSTDHTRDSLLRFIDPRIIATYQGRVRGQLRQSDAQAKFTADYQARCASLVPRLFKAGVNIVAGSDCGSSNSYVYPGESIHEEIKLLVASGLTPAQALQASVVNGPKFFGVSAFFGSLQPGRCSDLIVLDRNPLEDIGAIDGVSSIVSHGKMYTRAELNGMRRVY